ncbi:MAG: GxxExxY protein [Ignavibacteriaceae bacterium]
MSQEELNRLSKIILDASIEVHRNLGPGLLESVYETCLCKEMDLRKLKHQRQAVLPVIYKNEILDAEFRIDILVENEIIVELKAVEILLPIHEAQILTYLRLADKRLGFLINFNVPKLVDGFKRKVNNF